VGLSDEVSAQKSDNDRMGMLSRISQAGRCAEPNRRHIAEQAVDAVQDFTRLELMRRDDYTEASRRRSKLIECLMRGLQTGFAAIQCLCNSHTR
jgi:hypothetical protein